MTAVSLLAVPIEKGFGERMTAGQQAVRAHGWDLIVTPTLMDEGLVLQTQGNTQGTGQQTYQPSPHPVRESSRLFPKPQVQSSLYSGVPRLRDAALPSPKAIERTSPSLEVHHASPLASLRERDTEALEAFFGSDRMAEIALDIHRYLARIYPEPCWEDDPYDFLHGFI